MNIFRKIINRIVGKSNHISWNDIYGDYKMTGKPGKYKSYAFTGINARAENVIKANIYLYKKNSKSITEITEHPFIDLMKKPNNIKESFKVLLFKVATSLDLYGNAYLLVLKNVIKGTPLELRFLPAKHVKVILNTHKNQIVGYEYGNIKYAPDEIIHFSIPDPDNILPIGKATIEAFNFEMDIDYYMSLFQKKYFENGAALGLVLETDKSLSDPIYDRLKQQIENRYTGAGSAGKTLILENGLKANIVTSTLKDAMLTEGKKVNRDEILSLLRVPKPILGITDDVNLANAREAIEIFLDLVIKPFASLCIESKLNQFIEENYKDESLFVVMEYENQYKRELQLEAIDLYRTHDIASVEEIREMEGFSTNN